jgi:hypothetical protein
MTVEASLTNIVMTHNLCDASVLRSTTVARSVGMLRKHADPSIASAATALVAGWKELLVKPAAPLQAMPTGEVSRAAQAPKRSADDGGGASAPASKRPAPSTAPLGGGRGTVIVTPPADYDPVATAARFPGAAVAAAGVTRDAFGGRFKFSAHSGAGAADREAVAAFRPNRSPEEVLRSGAVGGTYFRAIDSAVAHANLDGAWRELPAAWTAGLAPAVYLARPWNR